MFNLEAYHAYDAGLPCKNPNCKSHGSPHPNCHCYSESSSYAKGGKVKNFCSSDQAHQSSCQYFADGGDIQPDSAIIPPQSAAADIQPDSAIIPPQDIQPDSAIVPPTDYETGGQQLLTGVEGAAQGVAGPIATGLELGAHAIGLDSAMGIDTSAEAQRGRAEANPIIHGASEVAGLVGGAFIPVLGEYSLGAKAAEAAEATAHLAELGNVGSGIIKGAVQTGLIQGSDEINKYLLGQNNDPNAAAAAILSAGALGGITGGLFGLTSKSVSAQKLGALADQEMGSKAVSFLGGMAHEANPEVTTSAAKLPEAAAEFNEKAWNTGQRVYKQILSPLTGIGATLGGYEGYREDGIPGAIWGAFKGGVGGFAGKVAINQLGQRVFAPLFIKALSTGSVDQLAVGLDHAKGIAFGLNAINNGVGNLFKVGGQQAYNAYATQQAYNAYATQQQKEKLREFIKNGGVNQQIDNQSRVLSDPSGLNNGVGGFAEGGLAEGETASTAITAAQGIANSTGIKRPAKSNAMNNAINSSYGSNSTTDAPLSKPVQEALNKPVLEGSEFLSKHYPELGTVLGTAKTRMSNYLSSIMPQDNAPKLAFDKKADQSKQERSYDRALGIAVQPLSVLNHIKEGTLQVEHLQHLQAMYPELHDHLQKKVTEQISQAQLDGEKPSHSVQRGLSMLLGTPLNSNFTQPNIAAAQAVFAQLKASAPAQMPVKSKKGTSTLTKAAGQYATADQAAATRQQSTKV